MARHLFGIASATLPSRGTVFALAIGFCLGITISYFYMLSSSRYTIAIGCNYETEETQPSAQLQIKNIKVTEDKQPVTAIAPDKPSTAAAIAVDNPSSTTLDVVAPRVRVLCWIMTSPDTHMSKARHIEITWGRRCDKLILMSSTNDKAPGAIKLDVNEGRDNLWAKTKAAFQYVYKNHFDDADWFLKADDDTYVIVENLRYMLSHYNSSEPMFFGRRFKPYTSQGYMSGGAGYVLSKEALRRFIEVLPDEKKCKQGPGGAEDAELGICLNNVGVIARDSRDSSGKGRFFSFRPEDHVTKGWFPPDHWIWRFVYYPDSMGQGQMSDYAITFHYITPEHMYAMEYFIYHLRPITIDDVPDIPAVENFTLPTSTTVKT